MTIGNDRFVADLPRQRADEPEPDLRDALSELAAVASAQIDRREETRAVLEEEYVLDLQVQERTRVRWRVMAIIALLAAIAGVVTIEVLTMPRGPHASAAPPAIPLATLSTAQALGDSARTRLVATGSALSLAACSASYAADAAASPALLPPPYEHSGVQDRYVAACLSG